MIAPSSGSCSPRYLQNGSAVSDASPEASETLYVLVVSLYQGSARGDRSALAAARTGARAAGAGFLPVNVLDEASARAIQNFVGDTSTPASVVVRRPGRIVTSLEGAPSADEQLVAQAARNAGAARR